MRARHGGGLHRAGPRQGGPYQFTADIPGLTELQAGGGVFACRYDTELCKVRGHRPAIGVLATVVGRPTPDRAILDIGQKSTSEYRTPPELPDHPGCRVPGLSAEHATVETGPGEELAIGAKARVIPGYSDFTFVLHDRVIGHRDGRVGSSRALRGRGMLQQRRQRGRTNRRGLRADGPLNPPGDPDGR